MGIEPTIQKRMRECFVNYPEIGAVYLFGSRSTGRAKSDSDYDLAVVTTPGRQARSRKLDILTDLARLGLDNIDLTFLDRNDMVLAHEAVRMNQVVYCRPEFDHPSFYSRVMRMYFDLLPLLSVQREAIKERLLHGTA